MSKQTCPVCGRTGISGNRNICPQCGSELNPSRSPIKHPAPRRSRLLPLAAVAVIVLISVLILLLPGVRSGGTSVELTPPPLEEVPTVEPTEAETVPEETEPPVFLGDDAILIGSGENDAAAAFILEARARYPEEPELSLMEDYAPAEDLDDPAGIEVPELQPGELYLIDEVTGQGRMETVTGTDHTLYNLIPGHTYRYIAVSSGRTLQIGRVRNEGSLRMLRMEEARNFRDLGGWPCDGGTVRYGLMIRGERVHCADHTHVTDWDQTVLKNQLGITCELDMREAEDAAPDGVSALGMTAAYRNIPFEHAYQNMVDLEQPLHEQTVKALTLVMDNTIAGVPTYFHCALGADRTGTLAAILEGILGCSDTDIDIDYELTTFADHFDSPRARTDGGWKKFVKYMHSFPGENPWVTWCIKAGIPLDTVNAFRRAAIDGAPADVELPVYEGNLLQRAKDEQGQLFNGSLGFREGMRLNSKGELEDTRSPVFVTGFIPVEVGKTIRFENIQLPANSSKEFYNKCYIALYNSKFEVIACSYSSQAELAARENKLMRDRNGYIASLQLNEWIDGSGRNISDASYFRISAEYIGEDSAIYVTD